MGDPGSEWQCQDATLSDKTARKEFRLTQDEIVEAIRTLFPPDQGESVQFRARQFAHAGQIPSGGKKTFSSVKLAFSKIRV